MERRWYSKKHFELLCPRKDTPQDIEDRIKRNAILEQVANEVQEKFPIVTPENIKQVLTFQEDRIKELYTSHNVGN